MTPYKKRLNSYIQRMAEDMQLRNLAESTINSYTYHVDKFCQYLLLPKINYFQVVFTLPDRLSGLILGNRRALYDLLFHAAWRALNETLRSNGQFQPAAHLVLHT